MKYSGEFQENLETGDYSVSIKLNPTSSTLIGYFDVDEKVSLGTFEPGPKPYRIRMRLNDCSGLYIVPKTKALYTFDIQTKPVNKIEHHDPDRPLPEPPAPSNILARMRQEFRSQLGVTRESFINDTGLAGYETDDDDPLLFEEELSHSQQNPEVHDDDNPAEPQTPSPQEAPEAPTSDGKKDDA